jgi:hypothetical protein
MMTECHRLRGLQMREARHHGIGMLDGAVHQRTLERGESAVDVIDHIANIEAEIGGDLIVARTRRVQTACSRPISSPGGSRHSYECLRAHA